MLLEIVRFLPRKKGVPEQVSVKCRCGVVFVTLHKYVKNGNTKSCGCSRHTGNRKPVNITHGLRGHELYGVWRQMMRRCYNDTNNNYHNYGGRGISVCEHWHDLKTFISDIEQLIGCRPDKATLDRKENDGNYEPTNVSWSTRSQQSRNQRSNRLVTIGTETKCLIEWAEITGIPYNTVLRRLNTGITGEDLISSNRLKRRI